MKQTKIEFSRTYFRNANLVEIIKQLNVHDRILARELFGSPRFDLNWSGMEYQYWFSGTYRVRRYWYDHINYTTRKIEYQK